MLLSLSMTIPTTSAATALKAAGAHTFRCKPEGAALVKELRKLQKKNYHIKTCHEATYVGYSLHRYLENKGIASMVVAPSLIPVIPGKKVKTDRPGLSETVQRLRSWFANSRPCP